MNEILTKSNSLLILLNKTYSYATIMLHLTAYKPLSFVTFTE